MADPGSIKMWHGVRRSLAIAALAIWLPLGLATSIGVIANLTVSDRSWNISAAELILRYAIPIVLSTIGAAVAVAMLRTDDPDRSRTLGWRLAGCYLGAYLIYVGASAALA